MAHREPPGSDERLAEEIAFHIDQHTEKLMRQGYSREDARREALRRFGGVEAMKESVRDGRTGILNVVGVSTLTSDTRHAFRRWLRQPGVPAAVVLTIGIGIAAVSSIFSVVDAVLLKPLPWANPESLVVVHGVFPERRNNVATAPTWDRWYLSRDAWDALESSPAFESVGVWHTVGLADTTFGDARDELIPTISVSSALLPTLGVQLQRGRYFTDAEDRDLNDSIIVSDEFWRRRLGAAEEIIGRRVMLGSARFSGEQSPKTVVGVIAPGFALGGVRPDVLASIGAQRWPRSSAVFRVVARLAPGTSSSEADAQAAALVSAAPIDQQSATARVVPIKDEQVGSVSRPLWVLFGGAGILLLIACSNVSGLLVGEAHRRQGEFAIRAAIGGSRWQVFRQLLVEQGLLTIAGVGLGLVAAPWVTGAIVAMAPAGTPRLDEVTTDLRTLMFAVTTGAATMFIFGIAPVLSVARAPVAGLLRSTTNDGRAGRVTAQRLAVGAQVALAAVLVTGAILFGETTLRLKALPLGFQADGVSVVATTFTGGFYGDLATVQAAWKAAGPNADPGLVLGPLQRAATTARTDAVLERLRAIPGVTHVAATSSLPFVANASRIQIALEDEAGAQRVEVSRQVITSGYFSTLGIRVLKGRDFERADAGGVRLAIVSAEFERRFFPMGALDRRFSETGVSTSQPYRIIGVVGDVKRQEPTDDERPVYYYYYGFGGTPNHFVIRTSAEPSSMLAAARTAVKEVSPQLVVTSSSTLVSRVEQAIVEERFRASLSILFGGAALLLAAVGIYALASRRISDRRREFAVRVALGAAPSAVRRLVVRDAAAIVVMGLAAGLPASFAVAQLTSALLFGVSAAAPHVFALTGLSLSVVVIAAVSLPSWRAGRVNPVAVLKE